MIQTTLVDMMSGLTECQKKAYKAMASGKNIFIHAPAGTGKSFLIEKYYKDACSKYGNDAVFKTATTGIAALHR